MNTAKAKPTLATGVLKTRKRNVVHKHDPEAFRDRVFEILKATSESPGNPEVVIENDTQEEGTSPSSVPPKAYLYPKKLLQQFDSETLDFSRYGEAFTEIIATGNLVDPGGNIKENPTDQCIFECADDQATLHVIALLHQLMRRKPFLRARYDSGVEKIVAYIHAYLPEQRNRLAYAVGIMIARAMLSPSVVKKLFSAAEQVPSPPLIESRCAIEFMARVLKAALKENAGKIEKTASLFKGGGIDIDNLVVLMPSAQKNPTMLGDFLGENELEQLVEINNRRSKQKSLALIKEGIAERITDEEQPADIWEWVQERYETECKKVKITNAELVAAVWDGITDSVDFTRKVQSKQQLMTAVKANSLLLFNVCKTGPDEYELLVHIQDFVSNDMELLKAATLRDVSNLLYQMDVFSEDTILRWYRLGTVGSAASVTILREQMEPFIQWLETADEDEEDNE